MKINPDSLILSHTVLAGFIGSQTAGDPGPDRYYRNRNTLCGLLEEVNNLTMSEELDWSITFRFRDIEA